VKLLIRPWRPLILAAVVCTATAQQPQSSAPVQAAPQAPIKSATVDDFVNQLAPPALTRSLSRNIVPQKRQIDLVVNFDFDSAKLQAASRPLLENLAQALQDGRLSSFRFQVEGHTDAQGTAAYNDSLSERRAQAVVGFLSAEGVGVERLQPLGKGFRELLDAADPKSAKNRRVRILTQP